MANSVVAKRKDKPADDDRLDVTDPSRWRASTPEEDAELDYKLGLTMVSIRLQKDVVEKLKLLATDKGLKYQPFVRMVLTQYVKGQKLD